MIHKVDDNGCSCSGYVQDTAKTCSVKNFVVRLRLSWVTGYNYKWLQLRKPHPVSRHVPNGRDACHRLYNILLLYFTLSDCCSLRLSNRSPTSALVQVERRQTNWSTFRSYITLVSLLLFLLIASADVKHNDTGGALAARDLSITLQAIIYYLVELKVAIVTADI